MWAAHSSPADAQSIDALPEPAAMTAVSTTSNIAIDAVLDDADWLRAAPATEFLQFLPDEGAEASQETDVRILYGASDLYVGAMLFDTDPDAIEAALGRRDDFNRADWFLVSIDSYNDKRTAYTFGVNAAGVQFDAIQTSARRGPQGNGNAPNDMDPSWDAIWEVSRRLTPQGWIVEMRIPYSMLRFSDEAEQTWGIQFTRVIPRYGEQSEWPHVPRTQRENLVSYFGQLDGIVDIEPRSNLQVTPYMVARGRSAERGPDAGVVHRSSSMDIGGDVKMGLGPNVTLDATINPDFGQVEADPAVLNLTAFETRLAERRPFFLEGMQIYQFDLGPGTLPYTRRIGGNAPIIGAAKVSGRTVQGLSFGVLGATTGDALRPDRHYGLARISQQIGTYSSIGGIATAFDGASALERSRSGVAGMDYDFRFDGNRYGMEGFAAVTHLWHTAPGTDSQTGYGAKMLIAKRQGVFSGFTGVEGFSDSAYFNDLGRVNETNFVATFLRFSYDINGGRPFGPFQRASIGDFANQKFSVSNGLNQGQRHSLNSTWTLRTLQEIQLGVAIDKIFGGYDIFETRGLGPWARPRNIEFSADFESDPRRAWQVGPSVSTAMEEDGGRIHAVGLEGRWNASARIELWGNVSGEWEEAVTAWTANETLRRDAATWSIGTASASPPDLDTGDFITLDDAEQLDALLAGVQPYSLDHYYLPVFGERDTRSVDLTLRGTVTFQPNLSLQLYGQLFVARGRYERFQLLRTRDDLVDFTAYPKRDDFAFSRLQSNAVLRWEYRPGSTLFLVWTHSRSSDDALNPLGPWPRSPYARALGGQVSDVFDVLPENVLLIKLNYTFLR